MDKNTFIKQLKDLVAFETVTGNIVENSKALNYVVKLLPKGIYIKRFKNKDAEILIAGNKNTMSPNLCYLVHIDVVSAKPEMFKAKVTDDKIFGRGTSDMKYSIPIGIELLNYIVLKKLNFSFSFVITTDEETDGSKGCGYLVEQLGFKPKALIIPDGGDNLNFVNKSKGVCWLEVKSVGSQAHASRLWMGKNAIEPLTIVASRLIKIYGKNSKKENWNITMNIGQINGGMSVNQVCNEASMKLDFRFPETDSSKKIIKMVKKIAKETDPSLSVRVLSETDPTFTDVNSKIVIDFIKSFESVYETKIPVMPTYAASDASHFGRQNVPILMIKPVGGEIHSENEWVSISSSMKFYDSLKIFINSYKK